MPTHDWVNLRGTFETEDVLSLFVFLKFAFFIL